MRHDSLKVGLFTDNLGPGWNGVRVSVEDQCNDLVSSGHDVYLTGPLTKSHDLHRLSPEVHLALLPSTRIRSLPAQWNGRGLRDYLSKMDDVKLDLVHVHGHGPVGLLGWYIANRQKIPLVMTCHIDVGAYLASYKRYTPFFFAHALLFRVALRLKPGRHAARRIRKRRRFFSFRRFLLDSAEIFEGQMDLLIAPSGKTARRMSQGGSSTRRVVPLFSGVQVQPASHAHVTGTTSAPSLLYVGRVSQEKNVDLLLNAFRIFRSTVPEARLIIIGAVPSSRLVRRAQSMVSCGVSLLGEKDPRDLAWFYSHADLFVLPSLTETQSLVLHEAAGHGIPILLVDPELDAVVVHGVNGRVARPEAAELAKDMLLMTRSDLAPEFKSMAAVVGPALANLYTRQNQLGQLLGTYRSLVDRHRKAADFT